MWLHFSAMFAVANLEKSMKKVIRQLFIYLKLPVAAFAVAAGLIVLSDRYNELFPFEFSMAEQALLFAAVFCILLAIKNHFSHVRAISLVREHLNGISEFETDIVKRLGTISVQTDSRLLKEISARLDDVEKRFETEVTKAETTPEFQPVNENIPPENLISESKIVPISNTPINIAANDLVTDDIEMKQKQDSNVERQKRFTGKLEEHLDQGKLQMFLQPALVLPDRVVTHYEAFARLDLGDNRIIKCGDIIAKAEKSSAIIEIDHQMLFKVIQLLRKLKREQVEPGIFWNISFPSLTSKKSFASLIEILRANSALCPQIVVEISQPNYLNLKQSQLRRFSSLRELGVRLSIDQCDDPTLLQRLIEDDLFSFIKIPIDTLVGYEGANHELIGRKFSRQAIASGIELVATHVEKQFQVLELIDLDITMAQGYLFSKPRPAKTQDDALSKPDNFVSH